MVVKPKPGAPYYHGAFESSVIQDGSKAKVISMSQSQKFESKPIEKKEAEGTM